MSTPLVEYVGSGMRYAPLTEPVWGDDHPEGLSNEQRDVPREVRGEREDRRSKILAFDTQHLCYL